MEDLIIAEKNAVMVWRQKKKSFGKVKGAIESWDTILICVCLSTVDIFSSKIA